MSDLCSGTASVAPLSVGDGKESNVVTLADRIQGSILGLALGDALGAPFEGGPLERLLWRLIGKTAAGELRWTDDTQMALDLVESLSAIERIDSDDLAARFAASYRWSRGYGPATAKVLRRIRAGQAWQTASKAVYPEGSFGNGAAMRAPIVGLFFVHCPEQIASAAQASAVVTHAHPLAIEGAVMIAGATAAAARGEPVSGILDLAAASCSMTQFTSRLTIARRWLASGDEIGRREIAHHLGHGMAAAESCVTALYLAMRFGDRSFTELQAAVAALGGDADTIGAMAGAIWGAMRGAPDLPEPCLSKIEQRQRLVELATRFAERVR